MPEPYSAVPRFPSTFQSLLAAAIFLATILVFIQSCRKMDRVLSASPTVSETENKFFNNHRSTDAREKALVDFLKRRNDSSHFVEKTVERIGYPRWDKAILVSKSNTIANRAGNNDDSTTFIYIPFARENENYVNAVMQVKATSADTSFSYVCDWQYKEALSSSVADTSFNALKYFMFFAGHDNRVFGHTRFQLKDNRILQPVSDTLVTANKQYMLELAGTNRNQNELMVAPDPELPHSSCLMVYDMINAGYVVEYYKVGKVCVLESYYLPVPSGGGGGAGNGGDDPSGDDPPPCDGGLSGRLYDPCGPGWEPLPIDDPDPIAQNLKKAYLKAKAISDSLFNVAQNEAQKRERAFSYALNNGDTVAFNIVTGTQYTSQPSIGQNIKGIFHTHQDEGMGNANQSFDGPDIFKMYYAIITNQPFQFQFIQTRDYVYAAYITDFNKFKSYVIQLSASTQMSVIKDKLDDLYFTAWDNCAGCSWQKSSEKGLLAITSNNNPDISGIKIYRSDKNNINFQPLTP